MILYLWSALTQLTLPLKSWNVSISTTCYHTDVILGTPLILALLEESIYYQAGKPEGIHFNPRKE